MVSLKEVMIVDKRVIVHLEDYVSNKPKSNKIEFWKKIKSFIGSSKERKIKSFYKSPLNQD